TLSSSVSLLYGLDELLAVVCFKRIIFWVDPYNLYGSFTIGVDAVGCSGFNSHFFEKMICRHLVCMTLGIPPFLNTLEWVPVRSTVNQLSARLDPLGQLLIGDRVKRFHIGIGHEQHFGLRQSFFVAQILDVHGLDRYTAF